MSDKPLTPAEFAAAKVKDQAALKARVETALAASVKTLGTPPVPDKGPPSYRIWIDQCWALVNAESTRHFADRAVRLLGGATFAVAVDDSGVTITRQDAPAPPPPAAH